MGAKDFDPLHAFDHAERFRSSVGTLSQETVIGSLTSSVVKAMPTAPYPELVLAFMATEIYLKCILRSIGAKPGSHHNLWNLFSAVRPIEHKQAIREYYEDMVARNQEVQALSSDSISTDFDQVLKGAGDLFYSLRYIYEEGRDLPRQRVLSVGLVMEAIRRYALELLIRDGRLYYLLAESEEIKGIVQTIEGGKKIPINKDTPDLRQELRSLFNMQLSGDPFSADKLALLIIDSKD